MSEIKPIETMPRAAIAQPAGRIALVGESRVGGTLMQRERAVRANIDYLHRMRGMAREAGSYFALLSGESHVSDVPTGQGVIADNRILNRMGAQDKTYLTFGTALAGPDYEALKAQHPNDRYKFYSSFDLTSPDKVALGNQWFSDVAERALAGIITELYPSYAAQGLYNSTPHFFQGSLQGVDPDHIGFVQEPIHGWPPQG